VKINNHGISEEFKIAIDSIYELYQAPSRIKRELIRMFPDLAKESFPTEQQLINYINYIIMFLGIVLCFFHNKTFPQLRRKN
jgi:hypothetical protein